VAPNDAYLPYRGASAGGGYTTAGDLLRFADALQHHKLLSAQDTQLLLTPNNARGGGDRYGIGFGIEHEPSGICFGHSGGSPGPSRHAGGLPAGGLQSRKRGPSWENPPVLAFILPHLS